MDSVSTISKTVDELIGKDADIGSVDYQEQGSVGHRIFKDFEENASRFAPNMNFNNGDIAPQWVFVRFSHHVFFYL